MSIRSIEQSDLEKLVQIDEERFLKIDTDPDFDVPAETVEWWVHTHEELLRVLEPSRGKATGGGMVFEGPRGIKGALIYTGVPGGVEVVAAIRKDDAILSALFDRLLKKTRESKSRSLIQCYVPDGDDDLLMFLQKAGYQVSLDGNHFTDAGGSKHDAWKCVLEVAKPVKAGK